ncbi:hypothetical protein [Stenotrophomonas sp.]
MTASRWPGAVNILPIKPYMDAFRGREGARILRDAATAGQWPPV